MAEYYLWLKALHIIAVISWMAGMLYLPRLFVYHAEQEKGSQASEMLKRMEHRLLRYIINPAMIATFLFGIALVSIPGLVDWKAGWIHAKLGLVLILAGFHGYLAACRKKFARDENTKSATSYRMINEVPTVIMIAIVILVVVKPF